MFAPFFWDIFYNIYLPNILLCNFVMVIWETFCYNLIWKNIYVTSVSKKTVYSSKRVMVFFETDVTILFWDVFTIGINFAFFLLFILILGFFSMLISNIYCNINFGIYFALCTNILQY